MSLDPGLADVPPAPLAPRRPWWRRASLVWLVPLGALAVALFVAWQSWSQAGPLVEITFENAAGITARETQVRYRDVVVGTVERVQFTAGLDQVLVGVRLDPEVAPYVDRDAQFWVVRPQVTTTGITGLETVLSGVYVEGSWDTVPGPTPERFEGLDSAPLLRTGQQGLLIGLRSTDGSLTSTMPIFYKGVQVGEVGPPQVSVDGVSVEAEGVIWAPHDALVTEATRFWDTSGFQLNITGAGAGVKFDNLVSLLVGGIAFDTFVSGAQLAQPGDEFEVYLDESTARDSVFVDPSGPVLRLLAVFETNVAGLGTGAAVELDGLRIGQVESVNGLIDEARFGDPRVRLQAVLSVQPARLGLEGERSPEDALQWLRARVAEGLRARLATGNILTGSLEVQLVPVADAPAADIDMGALPYPALPTTANDIADVAATAQGTLERIDSLPIEEVLQSAIGFLDNASLLLGNADAQGVPAEVRGLLSDIRGITQAPEVQAIPEELAATLAAARATAEDLQATLADLREAQGVDRILAAVDQAGAAAAGVARAAEGLPPLVARLDAVAAQAEALDLGALVAEVRGVATDARALLAQPALQGLPAQAAAAAQGATDAIAEARSLLASANAAEVAPRLSEALAAARDAAAALRGSVAGVPALVARLDALAAQAEALDTDRLVAEVAGLAAEGRALLAAPGTQGLPSRLGRAADEAAATLAQARATIAAVDADALDARLDATLRAAQAAAESLRDGTAGVPALVGRLDALAARAGALPLEALTAEVAGLAADARALVAAPATQALPADLSAALAEAEALLREAREGGVVANANEALAAARDAAAALPGLVDRANALLNQAASSLATLDGTAGVVAEAEQAIRQVTRAAEAVADLARTIERDPNSLIFGRD